MLIVIGIISLVISYIGIVFAFSYSVHHIDEPKDSNLKLYNYFLNKLNNNIDNESDFFKLIFAWGIFMISISFAFIGTFSIIIGIMDILGVITWYIQQILQV